VIFHRLKFVKSSDSVKVQEFLDQLRDPLLVTNSSDHGDSNFISVTYLLTYLLTPWHYGPDGHKPPLITSSALGRANQ
jgi:hypothetical protein